MKTKKIAYLSMEYALHQSLKIYSGGLGFLAGSHMRSAHDLQQDIAAIGILYTNGYHDQVRNTEGYMEVKFVRKRYSYLRDTGIRFTITIHGAPVQVKAYFLPSEVFKTAPVYLLTTDLPENDFLARSVSFRLYDNDLAAKIAQYILLGVGGAKLLEILHKEPDLYHLNEGHGLPLLFYLYSKFHDVNEVRKRVVFTTHTPEKAGNDEIDIKLLDEMSFFSGVPVDEVKQIAHVNDSTLNFTVTALKMSRIANGVSKIHGSVANQMWGEHDGVCKIISITNAQNKKVWMDAVLCKSLENNDDATFVNRKDELKQELLDVVADQTGKLFDRNVLTVVWARRFTAYKRADLILKDLERFVSLVARPLEPVQIIWAGKTYPEDHASVYQFNRLISRVQGLSRCAVLTGYEMKLSSVLKKGADVWLNTPRFSREASGTSGMTAAMNGAINFSIPDGWVPEFARHGENAFVIPVSQNPEKSDAEESKSLMDILEKEIIPLYYHDKKKWLAIQKTAAREAIQRFDSDRMAREYEEQLYNCSG